MKQIFVCIPVTQNSHLDSALHDLKGAIEKSGGKARILTLVVDEGSHRSEEERLSDFNTPLSKEFIEDLIGQGKKDKIFEFFVGYVERYAQKEEVILIRGIEALKNIYSSFGFNKAVTLALSAQIIFVASSQENSLKSLQNTMYGALQAYQNHPNTSLAGIIFTETLLPEKVQL